MQNYNPENIIEAITALDECLSKEDKDFILLKLGKDIGYKDYMKLNLIAAEISNSWINIEKSKLMHSIPNFKEFYNLEYGHAILKIYQRHLLREELHIKETLLKINWMECPKDILKGIKF